MPNQTDECVESVLDGDPSLSESAAWAICKAQKQGFDTDEIEAESLSDVSLGLEHELDSDVTVEQSLEQLAGSDHSPWIRESSEQAIGWIDTDSGAVVYQERETQADGFGVDVYRIIQTDTEGLASEGDILAVAVDMPNAGVYADWNIDAWPEDEQLSEAHVSDYGNIEDLQSVTQGDLELVETVTVDGSEVNQQMGDEPGGVLVKGLSQEGREYVEKTYDVDVTEQ